MARFIIVNEKDEVIGYKEKEDIRQEDIYQVSALWLENSKGEILLAQRALTKSHDPGKWGPAVAGTVEEGETYDLNIMKEAEEEIGLSGVTLMVEEKRRVGKNKGSPHNYFRQMYSAVVDRRIEDFRIQEDEVAAIRWFTKEELKKEIKEHPEQFLESVKEWAGFKSRASRKNS